MWAFVLFTVMLICGVFTVHYTSLATLKGQLQVGLLGIDGKHFMQCF